MVLPFTFFKRTSTFVVLFFLSTTACGSETKGSGSSLQTAEMTLAGKKIIVELAQTEEERNRGLMFREHLKQDHGMLFIFDRELPLSFWMKNTYIDLSIGFFDKNKTLVDIQEMKRTYSMTANYPSYVTKKPAQYALEMNSGWFTANKVKLGSRFEIKDLPKSRTRN